MHESQVLVTGASGLLGSHVVARLNADRQSVVAVSRSIAVSRKSNSRCIDFAGDWSSHDLPSKVSAIVHLAQSSRYREFPEGAPDVFRVNIDSTARLLQFAIDSGVRSFVYVSTGGLYRGGDAPVGEDAPLSPLGELGFYLGSKVASEILVQSYSTLLKVVILRPFFIYGRKQNRGMLIPRLYDSVKSSKPVMLDGPEGIVINPVHVDDASAAVIAAISHHENAIFNVAGPETLSIRRIAEKFGQHLGIEPAFESTGNPPRSLVGSTDAMAASLHRPTLRLFNSLDDVKE